MYQFCLAILIALLELLRSPTKKLNCQISLQTSGRKNYDNYLITHNDSGDKPKLYVISSSGKKIIEIKLII